MEELTLRRIIDFESKPLFDLNQTNRIQLNKFFFCNILESILGELMTGKRKKLFYEFIKISID